jgi:hypothetical protein
MSGRGRTGADNGRWRWRAVSPRRVLGPVVRGVGVVLLFASASLWVEGSWEPTVGPWLVGAGVAAVIAGTALVWRVPRAPWP